MDVLINNVSKLLKLAFYLLMLFIVCLCLFGFVFAIITPFIM